MLRSTCWILGAFGLVLLGHAPRAHAQCQERERINGSLQGTSDNYGNSVVSDGTVLVVGVPDADPGGATNAGMVYVYRHDGQNWIEEAALSASDGGTHDNFGERVALHSDRIVVGAPFHDGLGSDAGAAYIFQYSSGSWSEEKKLEASDGAASDRFGTSVAIEGTTVVVSSPYDDEGFTDRGAVYVYDYAGKFAGWQETTKLTQAAGESWAYFGTHVELDGGLMAVGASHTYNDDKGEIHLFENSGGWSETGTISPPNLPAWVHFGAFFDLKGDLLVAGLPEDDTQTTNAGSVLVLRNVGGNWTEETTLYAPTPTASDWFGNGVAVDGDTIVVGAPYADHQGSDAGMAFTYAYRLGQWVYDQPLGSSAPGNSEWLGWAVALAGDQAFVAAPRDSEFVSSSGSVFEHLAGAFLLEANGSTFSEGDSLTMTASCGTASTPCWFATLAINGSGFFQLLLRLNFAANHEAGFTTDVPPGLGGLDVTFAAFKINAFGKVTDSNPLTLTFQ